MIAKGIAESLAHVWKTLKTLNVPMALMGGIALAAWDRPRFTKDVDILIRIADIGIDALVDALRAANVRLLHDPPLVTIGELQLVQSMYEPPDSFMEFRIDLIVAKSEFQTRALERRVTTKLPGLDLEIDVLASEDLIVFKLCAGRVIDRADAAALLRANRRWMDVNYLFAWCRSLNLQAPLAEIWDEAFPGDAPPTSPNG